MKSNIAVYATLAVAAMSLSPLAADAAALAPRSVLQAAGTLRGGDSITFVRRGGAVVGSRGAAVMHRGGAYVGPRGGGYVGPRGGVAVGGATIVRRGAWVRPGGYWWRPGGAIAAGAAIGFVTAATAVAWAGVPPGPEMCWYYTDSSRTAGFWDVCP